MANKLAPAELVIARFNRSGVSLNGLARLLGVDPGGLCKWKTRGGRIPNGSGDTHRKLLALAKVTRPRVKLSADELIHGGVL